MKKRSAGWLLFILIIVSLLLTLSAGAYIFYDCTNLGGGWYWSPWFGFHTTLSSVNDHSYWFNHSEHTIVYITGDEDIGIYMYDPDYEMWFYTRKSIYPYLYCFDYGEWWWYQRGTRNPRWFAGPSGFKWYTMD